MIKTFDLLRAETELIKHSMTNIEAKLVMHMDANIRMLMNSETRDQSFEMFDSVPLTPLVIEFAI